MKSYKEYLFERRSNHENNPKISTYDYLKKYKEDPNVYISMTQVDKIGINPQSKFNTPLGIYCYPLKEIWHLIEKGKHTGDLPFAGDRPFVWILRSKNKNFINDMYKDYGSNNFDKDIEILKPILISSYLKETDLGFMGYEWEGRYEEAKANLKKYKRFVQTSENMENETEQEKEDSLKLIKRQKERLIKYELDLKELEKEKLNYINKDLWDEFLEDAIEGAKEKNPIMMFWNITRIMAKRITAISTNQDSINASSKWNWLLRQCGYSGFADKSGKGYIHQSEPTQAVFLTKDAFEVIDKIPNRDHKEDKLSVIITKLLVDATSKSFKSALSLVRQQKDKELLESILDYLLYRIVRYKNYNDGSILYNYVYDMVKYICDNIDSDKIEYQISSHRDRLFNLNVIDPDDKVLKLLNSYKD